MTAGLVGKTTGDQSEKKLIVACEERGKSVNLPNDSLDE